MRVVILFIFFSFWFSFTKKKTIQQINAKLFINTYTRKKATRERERESNKETNPVRVCVIICLIKYLIQSDDIEK